MDAKSIIKTNPGIARIPCALHNSLASLGRRSIRGRGNVVRSPVAILKHVEIVVRGRNNSITVGDLSTLSNCRIVITGDNNVVAIGGSARLQNLRMWLDQDDNRIEIGSRTFVRGNTFLGAIEGTAITIGEDCMFSQDIDFRTGDSHSLVVSTTGLRINKSESIRVGDHVWIARGVTCLKGVTIPSNTIIGSCSLLAGGPIFRSHTVIAGTPAREVREDVDWLRERI